MKVNLLNNLPHAPEERKQLLNKIANEVSYLENEMQENLEDHKLTLRNEQFVKTLALRKMLIAKCGEMSMIRLGHLEEIFKHYCIHVFRTGKYMTFDRLEYEKVHMTMERFFLFLKDFELGKADIEGKNKEILDKSVVISIYKRVSANSRELSFEEFIQCIQKLAILYWDQKSTYSKKKHDQYLKMQNIKKQNEKRRKKRMGGKKSSGQSSSDSSSSDSDSGSSSQDDDKEKDSDKQQSKEKEQSDKSANNENDDFVNDLMNNQEIEDPNEQVREVADKAKRQNQAGDQARKLQKTEFESLLQLSNEEKIEFYYQMLKIDSIENYKKKLTQLTSFIVHDKVKVNDVNVKALSESKLQVAMQHETDRYQKLKDKMNEKKEKKKERPLPKPSNEKAMKEEENSRKRKEMKKQRQNAVKEHKVEQIKKHEQKLKKQTPKIEYKESEMTLEMLEKVSVEHLKLKNFNPSKYYTIDDDDKYFLDEYGGSRPKFSQRFQTRERQSMSVVESTKMRAQQLQRKERQGVNDTQRGQLKQKLSYSHHKI